MLSSRRTKAEDEASNLNSNFILNNAKLASVLTSTLPSSKMEINGQSLLRSQSSMSSSSALKVCFYHSNLFEQKRD